MMEETTEKISTDILEDDVEIVEPDIVIEDADKNGMPPIVFTIGMVVGAAVTYFVMPKIAKLFDKKKCKNDKCERYATVVAEEDSE